jgi:hypothetical protein
LFKRKEHTVQARLDAHLFPTNVVSGFVSKKLISHILPKIGLQILAHPKDSVTVINTSSSSSSALHSLVCLGLLDDFAPHIYLMLSFTMSSFQGLKVF